MQCKFLKLPASSNKVTLGLMSHLQLNGLSLEYFVFVRSLCSLTVWLQEVFRELIEKFNSFIW